MNAQAKCNESRAEVKQRRSGIRFRASDTIKGIELGGIFSRQRIKKLEFYTFFVSLFVAWIENPSAMRASNDFGI